MTGADKRWFKNARFGMFIHWGLYSLTGRDMWYYSREEVPQDKYESLLELFNPVDYDPEEWARLAKRAGMQYAVITAKHHDGFCLWDSKFTDFSVAGTPYGQDLLKSWVDAFRKEGLKVGFYYSLLDWHHPHFTIDGPHPRRAQHAELNKGRDFSIYQQYLFDQIGELMTDYGKIDIVWFDFSYGKSTLYGLPGKAGADWKALELKRKVLSLQPGILINNRLDILDEKGFSLEGVTEELMGDFATPEQYIPQDNPAYRYANQLMWEACETIGSSWGYFRGDGSIKSTQALIDHLVTCVNNDGNLLLNVGPTPRGTIQPEFAERLEAIGKWLKINGDSIYGAGPALKNLYWPSTSLKVLFTQRDRELYIHFPHGQYPPYDITIRGLGGKVKHIEFLNDKTVIDFHEIDLDGSRDILLHLPVINPDPYDTVVHLALSID